MVCIVSDIAAWPCAAQFCAHRFRPNPLSTNFNEKNLRPADKAWRWVPSLYFSEGIPYVVVTALSVVMFKNFNASNADITFYTSWISFPWIIKPLWSPLVDRFRTKRFWVVALQLFIAAGFASLAFVLRSAGFFPWSVAIFLLIAFASATHDIAADGFYLLTLPPYRQAAFVGVRNTFYRLAGLVGQGGLVWLAGNLTQRWADAGQAWIVVYWILCGGFAVVGFYHSVALPRPASDHAVATAGENAIGFLEAFETFFQKNNIATTLGFLLLYRFAEALLLPMIRLFLLDRREVGGLGLTTQQLGLVYGTVGPVALILGGLLGGYAISRLGLKRLLWPMLFAMSAPNVAFILLAAFQPTNHYVVGCAVAVEQFGYGFGFAAYMVYMMMIAAGEHKTAHYAICTGFMALGLMLPGMTAGWLQEHLGYLHFFIGVCVATIFPIVATGLVKVDGGFGKKISDPIRTEC